MKGLCPSCLARRVFPLANAATGQRPRRRVSGPPHRRAGVVFGNYELLEEIARGGMGVVYKARQKRLNRLAAVKMMLAGRFAGPGAVRRFQTEALAAAQLTHPNTVAVYEIGELEGCQFFAMEYVEGPTLAEVAVERSLPVRQAARYLRGIAGAVQHAHDAGIIHRDLKPSNILIDARDQPRVTDFGLAKRRWEDADPTPRGHFFGSPTFTAPEQAAETRHEVGVRSDIYSLGAVLYFLLTGRPPFLAESVEKTLHCLLTRKPPAPGLLNPSLPKDLENICLKCLEKDPASRYPSARALAVDLEQCSSAR